MLKSCLLVALLALGCDNKKPEEKKDDTPAERLEAKPAPSPTAPTPTPTTAEAPAPAPADIPAECTALKDMIGKMNACAAFPPEKAQLTEQANALISTAGAPGVDKASLGSQCKGTADAIRMGGAKACAW